MRTHENVGVLELAWRSLLGGDKLVTEAVFELTPKRLFIH